jgi:MFS transporter, DHA2 family, multidrug resistance protein
MSEVTVDIASELNFTDGLPAARRRWAMLSYLVGLAMSVLDGNIANTALPGIATQLHASPAASVWVVDAFLLTVAICVVPLSSLVDIIGYKRVYQSGLVIFTLASAGCSLPHSLNTLILARVIQGIGAASIWSVSGAMMRYTYPRALLGRGIGLVGFVIFSSAAAGPSVASAILAVTTWHWLFAINIPFGLVALSFSERCLAPAEGSRHRWDVWSAVLNAITVTLLIRGIDGIGTGKTRATVAAELIGALFVGIVLVARQSHLHVPMLAIDLFKRPIFALASSASLCTFMAQGLAVVILPFYFIDVMGYSQVMAGLLLSPWPIAAGIMSHTSGRLADRIPIRVLGTVGMAGMTSGLILLSLLGPHPTIFQIAWRAALGGAGFGFFGAPNNRAMVASAPKERSGGAGGIGVMSRLLGQAIGVSFVAVIFELTARGGVTLHGVSVALLGGASCTAISGIISSVPQPHLQPE